MSRDGEFLKAIEHIEAGIGSYRKGAICLNTLRCIFNVHETTLKEIFERMG